MPYANGLADPRFAPRPRGPVGARVAIHRRVPRVTLAVPLDHQRDESRIRS
jgi:hypothetical protein